MKTIPQTTHRFESISSLINSGFHLTLVLLTCLFLVSCEEDALRLRTHLNEDETVAVGDPVLNSNKQTIGIVTAIEEGSDETRVAAIAINPVAVDGIAVRIEGANPIELDSRPVADGDTSTLKDDDFVDTQSRTSIVLDEIIPDNITSTKLIYLVVAVCVMLLVLLFIGKALVRAGAALALLILSLLAGWIGTGFATPVVESWLVANPPAELFTVGNVNPTISALLAWIPENPDPAWVAFIAIACFSYILLALISGFVRRKSSSKTV